MNKRLPSVIVYSAGQPEAVRFTEINGLYEWFKGGEFMGSLTPKGMREIIKKSYARTGYVDGETLIPINPEEL